MYLPIRESDSRWFESLLGADPGPNLLGFHIFDAIRQAEVLGQRVACGGKYLGEVGI
jgi:hypothetical protein